MKDALRYPGMQPVPRFPRRVYFIEEADGACLDEIVLAAASDGPERALSATSDRTYRMRAEPLHCLAENVTAAIRERMLFASGMKPGAAH